MSDTVAHKAKEEGSVAWSRGDYAKAIEHFSTAISHGGDKEFMRVLYSNRSAAYLKVKRAEDALNDAIKCIEVDSQWNKGYTRKGDALYELKRFTESYNAYNSGLRVTPGDSTLQEKCETAMRAIRNEASRSNTAAANGSAAAPQGLVRQAKLAVIIMLVVYCIPFLGRSISAMAFRVAAGLFIGLNVHDLYVKYGVPKFTSDYGMLIIPDPSTMKIFLGSLLLLAIKPYLFAIAPIFLSEVSAFLPDIFAYVRNNISTIESKVLPMIARFAPSMASLPLNSVFSSNNIPVVHQQLQVMSATAEIYQGIYFIIELVLPSRNLIGLYLWWQYLRMRVMLDQSGLYKRIFGELDLKINGLLAHQMVPNIIRQGYGMIRNFLIKQAEMPTAPQGNNEGNASFLPKCTIM